jgi:NAD(P)-dependent dehydrogenase (short-subunit alcohol dehydrogenase family)
MNRKQQLALAAGLGTALALAALGKRERLDFKGKAVLITGGSRGLGLVLARQLAAEGALLTLVARDGADLERAAGELALHGAEVQSIVCDVRERTQVQEAIERMIGLYGRIDLLINNAGVIQAGPIEHLELEDFEDALAVHMWGPLYMMLAALPHMRRQGSGRIANIASIGGRLSVPHLVPYCASKFALVGLSDGMRAELAKDNIKVTTVCPGLMRTGSHVNALFKGRHPGEFTWFSLLDSLPLTSIGAERAARQIVEACRYGIPHLTITLQAQVVTSAGALLPNLTGRVMALFNRMLPTPTDEQGDMLKSGWESQSEWAPSLLTRLSDEATVENNGLHGHAPLV